MKNNLAASEQQLRAANQKIKDMVAAKAREKKKADEGNDEGNDVGGDVS